MSQSYWGDTDIEARSVSNRRRFCEDVARGLGHSLSPWREKNVEGVDVFKSECTGENCHAETWVLNAKKVPDPSKSLIGGTAILFRHGSILTMAKRLAPKA